MRLTLCCIWLLLVLICCWQCMAMPKHGKKKPSSHESNSKEHDHSHSKEHDHSHSKEHDHSHSKEHGHSHSKEHGHSHSKEHGHSHSKEHSSSKEKDSSSSSSGEHRPSKGKGASCMNRKQNKKETDIDCGGKKCPPCADSKKCLTNRDCMSEFCNKGKCTQRPTRMPSTTTTRPTRPTTTSVTTATTEVPTTTTEEPTTTTEEPTTTTEEPTTTTEEFTTTAEVPTTPEEVIETEAPATPEEVVVTEEPATEAPATPEEVVVTEEPATEAPATPEEVVVTEEPTTEAPATPEEIVVTEEPVTEEPATPEEIVATEEPAITQFTCNPECKNGGTCIAGNSCICSLDFSGSTCEVQSAGLCLDKDTFDVEPILQVTFGKGSAQFSSASPAEFNFTTTYTQRREPTIDDGYFTFVNSIYNHHDAWHTGAKDHTGDEGGYMYLVNANVEPGQFYSGRVDNLCVGLRYEFSVYLANICKKAGRINPNVLFEVRSVDGNELLAQLNSGDVPEHDTLTWEKYGVSFIATNSSVNLLMISNTRGGSGNDIVIDDIALRVCAHKGSGFCPSQ